VEDIWFVPNRWRELDRVPTPTTVDYMQAAFCARGCTPDIQSGKQVVINRKASGKKTKKYNNLQTLNG